MTAEWYVLIEEDTRVSETVDGTSLKLHRWMLVGTHHIEGDEAQAVAAAEDAALHHVPDVLARHARPGDEPARHAFRAQDGSWVVLVRQRHRDCHIRVSTARLVHSQEEKEAPPKTLKELLRGALAAPPPRPKPWTPPGSAE
ncbi:hypothetical protein OIB37_01850 [Streptomyces sp. NBC_00820]|uniref:hypothetical protein n=1 Tax=Streptomyces sp. NBC_00820 TaxID=2975842 RepID=UPI002ED1AA24|nr:hypothetical protein OIB37_01850 [Streptomyces sp. NBC_00820]